MSSKQRASRLDFTALLDQQGRMLQLESALPALALVPERMVLQDAVSQPFELVLDAIGSSAFFELKTLVGEQLSVRLLQPDGRGKPFHGYVFEAAQLGSDGGLARYRLVMRPWLSFLALRRDAFVFQDKTAQQIVEEVFCHYPSANFRFELSDELRQRSLCVQYRETDLQFVQRLLAEEGLSWHFEHLDDGASDAHAEGHAKHVLVVTDRMATRPALGDARFTSQHPTASVRGQKDAVTAFMAQRQLMPNAVTLGSWDYKHLCGTAAEDSTALAIGELPVLEVYDGAGAYHHADSDRAARAAALALAALELDFERFEGQGSTRHFDAGRTFRLVDHPLFGANTTALNYAGALLHETADNEFVLLAVEHHATNNLGAQVAELLGGTELEHGSYKNHFHAARASTPVVPRFIRKPSAHGLQTALVVGVQGEPVTTDRDLRVKIQFPWQRGGNAPGNETSGTWVRVAQSAAGANWGQVFVPRIGSEVAVAFVEGDIDRPVVTGGLYNGQDLPPFSAGVDSGINHPGVIDGWHSQALDGAGFNQWALDNSTGQLRLRLHASYGAGELGLGHLIQQPGESAQRGAWRGAGFEAGTQGWASLRAGKGLLLSTSARPGSYGSAQGTQMDAAEAVTQLKAARDLGARLSGAARSGMAAPLPTHDEGQALARFVQAIDPQQDGRHAGPVNGQQAQKADGRTPGEPVETFAQPNVLLDTPSTLLMASEASIAAFAGQDFSAVVQGDIQHTAAHTYAGVSGQTTSWYTHQGGAKLHAANGPVSIQAHTDALQILADREVTVISVNDEITVSAKSRIELVAGQSAIVLDGANIDFSCPGKWQVKASSHGFQGGASQAASLPALPDGRATLFQEQFVARNAISGRPVAGMPYRIELSDGEVITGVTDEYGKTEVLATADPQGVKLYWVPAVDGGISSDEPDTEIC
ncbi:type VI secretion system Vgr family protein [Rubrivivax gelatinosus]|uniref:Type VI secretion system secreted protein VgrG n=1 Tax=Rubrivivax gelatinosus (strain NBRC 100245 / IL144) TaxID=983917 RepID=I0HSD3_RUBGI|nr:type VI secretion system Vgr family protein [Rubrivivax gelatinosus]BAL95920.1 hypothetical protein RGE_25810 [Rubrivivax gelatinosus IL144]